MSKHRILNRALILSVFFCAASVLSGQSYNNTTDSLKQLGDMTIKKTPPGINDYVRYCAFCHGGEGKGDGLNAFNIKTRPRDFTDTIAMRGKSLTDLQKVIRTGGAANNLSNDMPPWGKTLDSVTVARLAGYVMGLVGDRESTTEKK
jgi:cytochrome c553